MRRKSLNHKKIRILPGISIIAIVVFGLLFWNNIINDNLSSPDTSPASDKSENIAEPASIKIPDIDEDLTIETLGVSAFGEAILEEADKEVLTDDDESLISDESTDAPATDVPVTHVPAPLNTVGSIGEPVRITIPSINLNASIEKVALAADGSMDVPKQPLNIGWYEIGPRPGETGSAVIAGHVDWYNGATAVFANLYKLKPGDTITVQDDIGAVVSFVVREIRKFDAAADATDVFISNDGKAHLNIITCDGAWDKNTNQYSQRLIVFADKE